MSIGDDEFMADVISTEPLLEQEEEDSLERVLREAQMNQSFLENVGKAEVNLFSESPCPSVFELSPQDFLLQLEPEPNFPPINLPEHAPTFGLPPAPEQPGLLQSRQLRSHQPAAPEQPRLSVPVAVKESRPSQQPPAPPVSKPSVPVPKQQQQQPPVPKP